ncbi:glutathione peroxidase [Pelagicoccus sp. SDUM812003]|uniref:glutathione peroxidase n=1 Tax=Pelagicoccus sp. SDUM812003 TaxID=3041267 RepID=UPI00281022E1|nr:glutathione peroxidase [Pelagicoccus sp. SDUM812003]MDQ8204778.1 glutathione peroxidase [Pelagicoccus sp. SDUM812003]
MRKVLAPLATLIFVAVMNAASSIYEIPLVDIDGNETTLAEHKGKVMLIVNVASKCGYTKQYDGLEKLYDQYKDQGVVVLGFPCNQFGGQEPGTEAEIEEFCRLTFGVSFPMYSKIDVNGPDRHPLYQHLAGENSPFPGKISWNFNKFLVGKDGAILHRYPSKVEPLSDELLTDLKAAL